METVKRYLSSVKSRTVLTVIALVVINGVPSAELELQQVMGTDNFHVLSALLGAAAIFFRVNTRAKL